MASAKRRKLTREEQEELDHIEFRLQQIGGAMLSHRGAINTLSDEALTLQVRRRELRRLRGEG